MIIFDKADIEPFVLRAAPLPGIVVNKYIKSNATIIEEYICVSRNYILFL